MAEEINDKLHIRLHLYDTDLSVNVIRSEEGLYRSAAKLINETMNKYASVFKGKKSDKDVLYMAMLDIALQHEKAAVRNDVAPYSDMLSKLTQEIEEALAGH